MAPFLLGERHGLLVSPGGSACICICICLIYPTSIKKVLCKATKPIACGINIVTPQSHIGKKREKAHIEWVIYKESHEC
jgi:hypothetical protein